MQTYQDLVAGWFASKRDLVEQIREQLIGSEILIDGPYGPKPLIYADYAASGRALRCIENYILGEVLPYYANPHTSASFVGARINQLRADARAAIGRACHAPNDTAVIFAGTGATAGINKLAALLAQGCGMEQPIVLLGPYEHHSNILPWREGPYDIIEIEEGPAGGPALGQIEETLKAYQNRRIIGCFSAASNVTGIITDVSATSRLLNRYGALSIWDYAGAAPYLPIDMARDEIHALVLSPHKFLGGPAASGLLLVRPEIIRTTRPTQAGGGTVSFVSPWAHHYHESLVAREEAGTPNAIGDIRAGLTIALKGLVGASAIHARETALADGALRAWRGNDRIEILGHPAAPRIPIFSFRISDGRGGHVHQQLVTRLLSDLHGVQARGGCACAGPYAHRLLDIDQEQSQRIWREISAGNEFEKPGWTRVNLSYAMSDDEVNAIITAVDDIARRAGGLVTQYLCDPGSARFRHSTRSEESERAV